MKVYEKPKCKLVGTDGNVFSLAGKVVSTLKKKGFKEEAKEFSSRLGECGSYGEALNLMGQYVVVK